MTPRDFAVTVTRLRTAPRGPEAAMLVDKVRAALTAPWIDALDAAEAADALAVHDIRQVTPWTPRPLAVGETWLLLFEPGQRTGSVVRLRLEASRAASRSDFGADAQEHVRSAHAGMLASAAALCRDVPPDVRAETFVLPSRDPPSEISGGSLGLSVAVTLASKALARAPRSDVAGSAVVRMDGTLEPVAHLREKLAALRARWPHVREIVVAAKQSLNPDEAGGWTVHRCESLTAALSAFGLELRDLAASDVDRHVSRLDSFEAENHRVRSREQWIRLAEQAWETARVLLAEPSTRERSSESVAWAALFWVHAGEVDAAKSCLRELKATPDPLLPAHLHAWRRVVAASATIDEDPSSAVALAREALESAREHVDEAPVVYGQALGTLGRALMHDGRLAEAEPVLREAADVHAARVPREEARSRVYLATCVRKLGRPGDARQIVRRAIELTEGVYANWAVSRTTRLYLALEEGRCCLELGRADEALGHFERVIAAQVDDSDYPRLAAIRGVAAAARVLGWNEREADALECCLAVARTAGIPPVLQRVAIMAAGDALVARDSECVAVRPGLEEEWRRLFPSDSSLEAVRARRERWIY